MLTATSHCDGFNIGMNQGAMAGAGIAGHLHQHVVPRWATDANFFPIVAQTKALPRLLGEVRDELAAEGALARATISGPPHAAPSVWPLATPTGPHPADWPRHPVTPGGAVAPRPP